MSGGAFRIALERLAPEYGLRLDAATIERFSAHFKLLTLWNRKINLTRISTPEEAARHHFLESAFLTTLIRTAPHDLVDVGSGAGFPGLPLACLWPDSRVVLLEPLPKRSVFLSEAVRALRLENVQVLQNRFAHEHIANGALLVARAVDGFDDLLPSIMSSPAGEIALFSEPQLLGSAGRLRPGRTVQLPASERRFIGIFR